MSITARQVKNKRTADGGSTSRAGTVYDVFIRYKIKPVADIRLMGNEVF